MEVQLIKGHFSERPPLLYKHCGGKDEDYTPFVAALNRVRGRSQTASAVFIGSLFVTVALFVVLLALLAIGDHSTSQLVEALRAVTFFCGGVAALSFLVMKCRRQERDRRMSEAVRRFNARHEDNGVVAATVADAHLALYFYEPHTEHQDVRVAIHTDAQVDALAKRLLDTGHTAVDVSHVV